MKRVRTAAALIGAVALVPSAARAQAPPPDQTTHVIHDSAVRGYLLVDQLEWLAGRDPSVGWDAKGWVGGDRDRFWFRTEGEGRSDRLDRTETHLVYGRPISPWWEVVAGLRTDDGPGPSRTWAAVGLQGLAPYWFEIEATGYVGAAGRTHARVEVKYELLLTNRVVLQPLVELEIYGKDDPARQIGAGFSSADIGLRLRYEAKREFAAYIGVLWSRAYLGTADFMRSSGREPNRTRFVTGLRFWR